MHNTNIDSNSIFSTLSTQLNNQVFETWIRPLSFKYSSENSSLLYIEAPNQFISDFVDKNYKQIILQSVKKHCDWVSDISFFASGSTSSNENNETFKKQISSKNTFSQHSRSQNSSNKSAFGSSFSKLNKKFTFDTFISGPSNQLAKNASLAVAQSLGSTKFNPILIYSGVGLGKTHLLHAIGNYVQLHYSSYQVLYLTSEEFYLEFINAIKNNTTKEFSESLRFSDILILDDVQFLSGKESTQEEFFYIFNSLHQRGKQIVLSSDSPPSRLSDLHDRLISRFQWGLCVDIQPPELETRVAILKKKAETDNLSIPEDVIYYIAEHITTNIRDLEGSIIRLLAYSSIRKTDITIDLVKSIFQDSFSSSSSPSYYSIDTIISNVAEYYKIPEDSIREKNRRKEVALCRQVAMYIAKHMTNYSLKTIGLNFGGRDHSTVIHAITSIDKLCQTDSSISNDIKNITNSIKN